MPAKGVWIVSRCQMRVQVRLRYDFPHPARARGSIGKAFAQREADIPTIARIGRAILICGHCSR